MRVLIAEDNAGLREGLSTLLMAEGYQCQTASDGTEARDLFDAAPFPLVLLDVVMPGLDGLRLCRYIRARAPAAQILILSARGEPFDKATGLERGADDYMAKPFDPAELLARVATMARRAGQGQNAEAPFRMGDLLVDPARLCARRGSTEIALTLREVAILRLLHAEAGRPVSRDRLFDECWGRDYFPNSRALDQYISALRHRIEADPAAPAIIGTVRGVGYRYNDTPRHDLTNS
ncbi:MAG: DNA-binding response regulator [Rhodobacteraceae bacterium GWE1_64_9]|jgi:DNA-binding response OmpR family regulator|nr:MAG: DNA-binding response regulator [Rhodobacteraceae bacterium GWE1_64_9]OHC47494.1 MAG: DNA-binding response regulator [Rhodobacteraceae bacterium GWF1_65_7]